MSFTSVAAGAASVRAPRGEQAFIALYQERTVLASSISLELERASASISITVTNAY